MSRSYNFVSHVEFNHVEEISKLLKARDFHHPGGDSSHLYSRISPVLTPSAFREQEGANPDLSHAGVRPLHLAAELVSCWPPVVPER